MSANIPFVTAEDVAMLVEEWNLEADVLLRVAEELPTTAKWASDEQEQKKDASSASKQKAKNQTKIEVQSDEVEPVAVVSNPSFEDRPIDAAYTNEARYRRLAAIHQSKAFEAMTADAMQARTDQLTTQRKQMEEVNKIVSQQKAMRGST